MSEKQTNQTSNDLHILPPDNHDTWHSYWCVQGQPWRTQPEIDEQRQVYLSKRRTVTPEIKQGIYPYKDIRLSRADVEWLLATHENGCGPVDWSDPGQRERMGLDLRGADLHQIDLSGLPLARMHGGLSTPAHERVRTTIEQSEGAAVHFEGADLGETHLEGAVLEVAHLERTWSVDAHLEGASLISAHLERADLSGAHLEGADLRRAHLDGAWLAGAHLEGKCIDVEHTQPAHQQDKGGPRILPPADLRRAYFNIASYLAGVNFGDRKWGFASLADVSWGGVNLSTVKWSHVHMVGDEYEARSRKTRSGKVKDKETRLTEYEAAVRANRQLARALQEQGLNEHAAYFAYRARRLQQEVLRRQGIGKLGQYLFSLLLDALAGYGYRPMRSVIAYLIIILGFMGLYLLNAQFVAPHLRWDEALVLSVSSFHGRGFFTQSITLGDTYARLAAAEAVIGLFIEISFIATFTQRFFGK